MVRSALSLLGLAALAAARPLDPRQAVTCVSGLYILVARGSYQDEGEGSTGAVADLIEAGVPNSVSQAIDYPATIIDLSGGYFTSVRDGIEDTQAKIQAYVDACGSASRIALLGYSQGANVMTSTLAGGDLFPDPLSSAYGQYIEAVVAFADPTHNEGQSYDAGNSTTSGIFARDDTLATLNTYASVLRSYCDDDDPFCASGGNLDIHYGTVSKYAQDAATFVIGLTT